jgi:raffinose/stachyose/melibiose transport system substrate-binding protein
MLREAGVAESMIPPKTWDEWLTVCDKVKKAGHVPIAMGSKDKLLGDWLQAILLYQQLDSYSDVVRLCTGQLRWDDPRYYEHWNRLKQLWDLGYINKDVNSLDLYQGQEMLSKGDAAFTIAVGSIIPAIQEALGAENVGYMRTPTYGIGKLKDRYVIDIQGIGMAKKVDNQKLAAEFLKLMHRPDRVTAMYSELRAFPADKGFDPSVIKDPIDKEMWSWFKDGIIYLGDVVPYAVTDGAANSGCQQLFAGTATPADLGKEAQRLIEEWRAQSPDMLDNYLRWMK